MKQNTQNKGGRPRLQDNKLAIPLSISASFEHYNEFIKWAKKKGISRAEFFREIFEFYKEFHS